MGRWPTPCGARANARSAGDRATRTGAPRISSAPGPRRDRGDAHKRCGCPSVALNRASILLAPVSDKRAKHKSKLTLDRQIPGAFEGETVTRRRFMTGTAHTTGAIAASAFALPALGFAIGPIFKGTPQHWEPVGTEGSFSDTNYIPVVLTVAPNIGEAGKTTVYVRRFNREIDTDAYDRSTPYIAISSRGARSGWRWRCRAC